MAEEALFEVMSLLFFLMMGGGLVLQISDPFHWGDKRRLRSLQRKAKKNNTSVSFELTKRYHLASTIFSFASTDAEEIRRNRFNDESFAEFDNILNVFTKERLERLERITRAETVFDANSVSESEWVEIFGTYKDYLKRNVDKIRASEKFLEEGGDQNKGSVDGALYTLQKVQSSSSPLSITADADKENSLESIIGTEENLIKDFRSHWEKQYEEIMSSNETSSQKA